jgi:hypothetical protein
VLPASAVIALFETSLANLIMNVPFWDGVIIPSMTHIFPAVSDVALLAAGISYAVALFVVTAVAVSV